MYLIGTDSFKSELESVGINVYGGEEENNKLMDTEIFRNMNVDPDVEAVVIGEDERFNYYKLNMASIYLKVINYHNEWVWQILNISFILEQKQLHI